MTFVRRAVLLSAVFCFSGILFAAKKSLDEYWQDVALKFSAVEPELTSQACYADQRAFLACAYALNAMLSYEKEPMELVPHERYRAESGFGPVLAPFESVDIVEPRKFESDSTVDFYGHLKQEREKANASWSALYEERASVTVPFAQIVAWIRQTPIFEAKESVLTAAALNRLLSVTKDPHTMLVPAAYVKDQSAAGSDDFTGIGVVLHAIRDGGQREVVVQKPMDGGPALKAGLRMGDILVRIDGENVEGWSLAQVSTKIQGPLGAPVVIVVKRKSRVLTFTITRDQIRMPNVVGKVLSTEQGDIGYVKLSGFLKEDGCDQLKAAVGDLQKKGVRGLVFDLRENPGGLLLQAVCVAGIFLGQGELVVSTENLSGGFGASRDFKTTGDRLTDLPLVTLINGGSASASELVAGALQDNQRAILVGERTFGKGTVQTQTSVAAGRLVLRKTVAKFYLPSGRSNQIEGVYPDLLAYRNPSPTEEDKFAQREEDEYMALPPTGPKWKQPRPEVTDKLQACVARDGSAIQAFNVAGEAALPPDYQLLVAQDTIQCMNRLGLGIVEPAHFAWPGLPFSFSWGNSSGESPFASLWKRLSDSASFGRGK